jgi:hypothetical protein
MNTRAVVRELEAIEVARAQVEPHVGTVMGMDSAANVYREALRRIGVESLTAHPDALPDMWLSHRMRGTQPVMDTASLAERFPEVARIKVL